MSENKYICPVCRIKNKGFSDLTENGNSLKCSENHSFDKAKEGYFNFDMKNSAADSGDSKEMSLCRREFLSAGHYEKFALKISEIAEALCKETLFPHITDAGCGEGYYMRCVRNFFNQNGKTVTITGADLAKSAIKLAAKSEKQILPENQRINFCVSSIFELPLACNSQDIVFSIFAPVGDAEAKRVLKKGGYLVVAGADTDHLYEFKEAIYTTPYKNREKIPEYSGFYLKDTQTFKYVFRANSSELWNLFTMTPYFWKTSQNDAEKIKNTDFLDVTAHFFFHIYQKE